MALIATYERANEYRIEITGRFSGESVREVENAWHRALQGTATRKYIVDITGLTGYDQPGRKLLREMYQHGTEFAAATPASLVFLSEISTRVRNGTLQEVPVSGEADKSKTPPAKQQSRASSGK